MAKRNFLSVTAQKFAAKKLALRRSILRRLAARRMAKRAAGLGLALFMLCGCSIGQLTTLYNEDTSFVENGIRYDAAHQPITGVYHKYADNMQLREEIHYVNGLADGLYRVYDDEGNVALEAYYDKGLADGKTTAFYADGEEKEILVYRKGKLEGRRLAYYPNGDLLSKGIVEQAKAAGPQRPHGRIAGARWARRPRGAFARHEESPGSTGQDAG